MQRSLFMSTMISDGGSQSVGPFCPTEIIGHLRGVLNYNRGRTIYWMFHIINNCEMWLSITSFVLTIILRIRINLVWLSLTICALYSCSVCQRICICFRTLNLSLHACGRPFTSKNESFAQSPWDCKNSIFASFIDNLDSQLARQNCR